MCNWIYTEVIFYFKNLSKNELVSEIRDTLGSCSIVLLDNSLSIVSRDAIGITFLSVCFARLLVSTSRYPQDTIQIYFIPGTPSVATSATVAIFRLTLNFIRYFFFLLYSTYWNLFFPVFPWIRFRTFREHAFAFCENWYPGRWELCGGQIPLLEILWRNFHASR